MRSENIWKHSMFIIWRRSSIRFHPRNALCMAVKFCGQYSPRNEIKGPSFQMRFLCLFFPGLLTSFGKTCMSSVLVSKLGFICAHLLGSSPSWTIQLYTSWQHSFLSIKQKHCILWTSQSDDGMNSSHTAWLAVSTFLPQFRDSLPCWQKDLLFRFYYFLDRDRVAER